MTGIRSSGSTYLAPGNRRKFIGNALSCLAVTTLSGSPLNFLTAHMSTIKAIAFDAFPIFDTRPVLVIIENMFPGKGTELGNVWRTKQFEYSWLRTAAGQYNDFWKVTEDALVFAAAKTGLKLPDGNKKKLMDQYLSLNIWPDVLLALQLFRKHGIRLSLLSNMTPEMLNSSIAYSKIENYFENIISTDSVKSYKPDPAAYRLGVDILKLKKEEILFVAFAGWDAAGAKWFGYPTFWLNRQDTPAEELDVTPDATGKNMTDLISFLKLQ